jgi:hypothetical protein
VLPFLLSDASPDSGRHREKADSPLAEPSRILGGFCVIRLPEEVAVTEVERLRDELELAEAAEELEAAREKMHADRTEKTVAAYKAESEKVAALRQAFRTNFPRIAESGENGVATPDPVRISGKAVQP